MKLFKSYAGVRTIFGRYWDAYGGWKEVFCSPYMHVALVLTVLLHHFWMESEWWTSAASILPNIVGFALGGYAIWIGFGDEDFRRAQAVRSNGKASPYVAVSASFAHFILIQLLALLSAICAGALNYVLSQDSALGKLVVATTGNKDFFAIWCAPVGHFIGFFLFMYSLTAAVAASMAIFRVVTWFERDEIEQHHDDA